MSASVFPARAGMSPDNDEPELFTGGVPRASGDEPNYSKKTGNNTRCSPRERG